MIQLAILIAMAWLLSSIPIGIIAGRAIRLDYRATYDNWRED